VVASGMPLGVTIARASVMDWKPGAHASTFGGNPVCIAAALATFDLLEKEYIANALEVGGFIFERLADWRQRFKIVGDVRGQGLMVGIELVRDQKTKQKARDLCDRVVALAFDKGLLILGAGDSGLRLSPPLMVDREQAAFALDVLEECLEEVQKAI
jgi:4-aminobutyrate aminotransferase